MARHKKVKAVNLDDLSTWIRYRKGLCDDCNASCCTLPVEVDVEDLVRMGLLSEFAAQTEPAKTIAKNLAKQGIVEHFNFKSRIFTLTRLSNSNCLYLDPQSRRCTIYHKRPKTCREHPQVGPKPNYCAYIART